MDGYAPVVGDSSRRHEHMRSNYLPKAVKPSRSRDATPNSWCATGGVAHCPQLRPLKRSSSVPTQTGSRPLNTPSPTCFLGIVVPIRKSKTGTCCHTPNYDETAYETCGESRGTPVALAGLFKRL